MPEIKQKEKRELAGRKSRSAFLVGMLFVGLVPMVANDAAAAFTQDCAVNDSNWQFSIGHSSVDGFVIKDVKFGATPQYHMKYVNSRWADIDIPNGGLVTFEGGGSWTTSACPGVNGAGNGLVRLYFDPSAGNDDGNSGVRMTLIVDYTTGGYFRVTEISSKGDDERQHELGIDVDCSENGNSDASDDRLRFDHTFSTGASAQVRTESDAFGNGAHQGGRFIAEDDGTGTQCLRVDSYTPTGDSTYGYYLQCTACTAEAGSSQYTNGPWDYLNGDSTWNADVMLAVDKYTPQATDGTGDFTTEFSMQATVI